MRFSFEGEGCFPTGRHYPGIAHLIRVAAAGLIDGIDAAAPVSSLRLVSIDTETTGRDWEHDRVIEIGCVVYEGGVEISRHGWLINPECPIPEDAFAVHGISDADVADKPRFAEIVPELLASVGGAVPVAYNADFDRRFLMAELRRAKVATGALPGAFREGTRWVDPLTWARYLHASEKSKALGAMASLLGVELENAHRATDDAAAAGLVLLKLMNDSRVPTAYGAFLQEQSRLALQQSEERQYWR